jgi:hypothetical protein
MKFWRLVFGPSRRELVCRLAEAEFRTAVAQDELMAATTLLQLSRLKYRGAINTLRDIAEMGRTPGAESARHRLAMLKEPRDHEPEEEVACG